MDTRGKRNVLRHAQKMMGALQSFGVLVLNLKNRHLFDLVLFPMRARR